MIVAVVGIGRCGGLGVGGMMNVVLFSSSISPLLYKNKVLKHTNASLGQNEKNKKKQYKNIM